MDLRGATDEGLVDRGWWRRRQDDYLAAATAVRHPGSVLNVLDHLERARRDGRRPDLADVTPSVVAGWCRRIDGWLDCADFDVLRLLLLWSADRDALPDHVVEALRARFIGFRYWYTDPGPAPGEAVDARWYWSENHRLIFHTVEHLAGQALPDELFTAAGLTGAEHRERAAVALAAWFDEKAADGFSEWHSDAYSEKDLVPLLALAEGADDAALAERAATFADLVLVDLALHSHRDNLGSTHGRSYMRFKATGPTQTTFSALKLCFDRTDAAWPLDDGDDGELLPATEGASFLARCHRYRPPAIVRRIATSTDELLDREGMGTELDPAEAPGPSWEVPARADGLSYTDPAMVPFWWDRGALTPWQLVPLTLDALDRHHLWDGHLFAHIRSVRDALGDDRPTLQALAYGLHRMVNAGLLTRVDTCTWRNGDGMLSTAQGYRPGCTGYQHHVWQATLDERAVVFTTHPAHGPTARAGDYLDGDRYWTGSATLPRAVQHGRAVVVQYAPGFAAPDLDVLAGFGYADETHAYLPTERFDEVVRDGPWTLARRRDGYVALWSWRPVAWRVHDPATTFTNGLVEPFDLVATGGPDDVWVCEVGDADRWGSFAAFAAAVTTAAVEVEDHGWGDDGAHRGFAVAYTSPAEGHIEVGWEGPLRVDGREVAITGYPRMQNRYVEVPTGGTTFALADEHGSWTLDLMAGTRRPAGRGPPPPRSDAPRRHR
ncbi:hypothetical protein HC251_11765 [Iamia sp. SCSIO 61187]|uniref:hypothetical protein n=1 Tax=Iamia sp. SCSIO 61187 TaxID=2722752 RepID=UPI001C626CB2|nr:hypothetical protein [Iamia sp. SCSIO 61187]QYG93044.1 hypothetical protein HC251_11765 [Iamia sp. SCSIO 61187]